MAKPKWPTLEEAEKAKVSELLNWNQSLPAPEEGTENYGILARIVARLREIQADCAEREKPVPEPDHPGWPLS
jgi:hypothetical protein